MSCIPVVPSRVYAPRGANVAFHQSPYGGEPESRDAVGRGLGRNEEEDERDELKGRSSAPLPDTTSLISVGGGRVSLSISVSRPG